MQDNAYSYSSAPHALSPDKFRRKSKYRSSNTRGDGKDDIFLDSRVINSRNGSVPGREGSQYSVSKSMELSAPKGSRKVQFNKSQHSSRSISHHKEDYLEELMDKPIEVDDEVDVVFAVKPVSAKFVKSKLNVDSGTQIESGDFFEFDVEVEPILEVLVGKTLYLSLIELREEHELDVIRMQQEEFEAIRNIEIAELHRMEAEHKRKNLERDRREQQEHNHMQKSFKQKEDKSATIVANEIVNEIDERLFASLARRGHFDNKVEKEVREMTIKEMRKDVLSKVQLYKAASAMAEELLLAAIQKGEVFGAAQMVEREKLKEELRRRKLQEEAEEAARKAEEEAARKAAEEAAAKAEEGGEVDGEMG
mmetsp:Transcript_4792/g.6605  ORF Transcript_4792/g.6605 Transcript_4792/m.6605 type:complete len:365 (-) Transcript_4792:1124-2218(-)